MNEPAPTPPGVSKALVICSCFDVRVADVRRLQRAGVRDADAIATRCGVGASCGACWHRLVQITGSPGGVPAQLVQRQRLSDGVHRCRFEALPGHGFSDAFQPGQHSQVSVQTRDGWTSRPYTLVSPPDDPSYREIIVRRQAQGAMSGILTQSPLPLTVRLGHPRGDAFGPLTEGRPTVFLVAGVGLTTALAAMGRPARDGPRPALILVVLRAPSADLLALLRARFGERGQLLRIHDTARDGRLTPKDLAPLVARHRGADWFLCGPSGFMDATHRLLRGQGIRADAIHRELFQESTGLHQPAPRRRRRERVLRLHTLGLFLLAAWLFQSALVDPVLHPAFLRTPAVRLGTGAVALLLLAVQMLLPVARARRGFARFARLEYRHRVIGVLTIIAFAAHAQGFGVGVIALLAVAFLVTTALGLVDKRAVSHPRWRAAWARIWLPTHILGAVLTLVLAIWHAYLMSTHTGFAP